MLVLLLNGTSPIILNIESFSKDLKIKYLSTIALLSTKQLISILLSISHCQVGEMKMMSWRQ